ncbi:MAG: hypothetical protein Q8R83_02700 [Legionellaceae bacterium]|nr:hypothetical protein [Legionellaceae bacterium]
MFTKIFYAIVASFGLIFYYKFANLILKNVRFPAGGLALLFAGPFLIIGVMERQIYSPFPFLMFFPMVFLQGYYNSSKPIKLYLALFVAFCSSIYLEYSMLSGIIFCWIFLFATQLLPIKGKHLIFILIAIGGGIFLHLMQNMLYLGPELFFKELYITLSNRITGYPKQDEIRHFYEAAGIVHHGSKPVVRKVWLSQIYANFNFEGLRFILSMMCVSLVCICLNVKNSKASTRDIFIKFKKALVLYIRIIVWLLGTMICPIMLFPAFAQEVNLMGVGLNNFLNGIGVACILGFIFNLLIEDKNFIVQYFLSVSNTSKLFRNLLSNSLIEMWLFIRRYSLLLYYCAHKLCVICVRLVRLTASKKMIKLIAWIFLTSMLFQSLFTIINRCKTNIYVMHGISQDKNWASALNDLSQFKGELFMTNINSPTPGLITQSVGFGVCNPDSILDNGSINIDKCKVIFSPRRKYWAVQKPKYFYYFKNAALFPGFADCLPGATLTGQERGASDCMDVLFNRLINNYNLAYKNDLVWVFDMQNKENRSV